MSYVESITSRVRSMMEAWLKNTSNKVSGNSFEKLVHDLNDELNLFNISSKEMFPWLNRRQYDELLVDIMLYDVDEKFDKSQIITFEQKLMLDNPQWDEFFTNAVIREYKRLLYLRIKYGTVACPYIIDQVWHMHILYTKEYLDFCNRFNNGEFIHHNPDRVFGNSHDSFKQTISNYINEFDEYPPDIIWFNNDVHVRISLRDHYIINNKDIKSTIKILFKQLWQ